MAQISVQKKLLFSILTTIVVLGLAELTIQHLHKTDTLELTRQDDQVLYVDDRIFQQKGHRLLSVDDAMLPIALRATKGNAWRTFVVGGSFAMGSPYATHLPAEFSMGTPDAPHLREPRSQRKNLDGGIPSWLALGLKHSGSSVPLEVANTTTGGQNSHRSRRVVEQLVHHDPDLLIVMTCNNEGEPPPSLVSEELRELGGYRLLSKLIRGEAQPTDRPVISLQRAEHEELRHSFMASLQAIAAATEAAGVPVLLATLPLNLMLEGVGSHRMIGAPPPTDRPACATAAQDALKKGDATGALAVAQSCENLALAAYWSGRSLLAQGQTDAAHQALTLAAELQPSNRCRPSFQQVIREVAASHEHVHLLDLEAQAVADAPLGLPGGEQFLDSCHMDMRGYLSMAERTRQRIVELGLGPSGATAQPLPPDVVNVHMERWKLSEEHKTHERPPQAAPTTR